MALSFKKRAAALLAFVLCISMMMSACAGDGEAQESPAPETPAPIPSPTAAPRPPLEDVRVYFDGLLSDRGYLAGDTVYLSPEAICAYHGLELHTESSGESFTLSLPALDLSGSTELEYMTANGRYLYVPEGYLEIDGRIYLSAPVLERALGLQITLYGEPVCAEVSTLPLNVIRGGENYYDTHVPTEDLYWLSRIIYAEAKEQPLAGLIGVGNVVLNRVESDSFPNTVFDVIHDREYTVQFDPAATGSVKGEPDELSVIAACLCFEGYNTVGDSLYFVNPITGDSSWFESSLTYVTTIGGHDFYA